MSSEESTFHEIYGRADSRGVRTFRSREGETLGLFWIPRLWVAIGVLEIALGLALWLNTHRGSPGLTACMTVFMGGLGLLLLFSAGRLAHLRRAVQRAESLDRLGARLGVQKDALRLLAYERSVLPRYNVNGEDLYYLADFGDAATLLRASAAPDATETLLRAAAPQGDVRPAELLRPAATNCPDADKPALTLERK